MSFIPDPITGFTPKGNPPRTAPDAPAVDINDPEAVRKFAYEKLIRIMISMPDDARALPVIKEYIDRMEGRAGLAAVVPEKNPATAISRIERVVVGK